MRFEEPEKATAKTTEGMVVIAVGGTSCRHYRKLKRQSRGFTKNKQIPSLEIVCHRRSPLFVHCSRQPPERLPQSVRNASMEEEDVVGVPEALNIFSEMNERGCMADVATYNSLIKHFCKIRRMEKAFELLDEME
ncbi:putative pentatricopeptide repeat-containing protein [Nymphaea thermarum]|nr:putative pentatricopeptide repeat-containing protein [Nymphaea thermarum]